MSKPVLIFDFDGTIADTHHFVVEISNRLALDFGYKTLEWEEVEFLKDKTVHEALRYMEVPILKFPVILAKARKEFYKGLSRLKPFAGMREVLHRLKSQGIRMGIVSSNSVENIEGFLENHDLNVFDFIHHSSRIWGKNISLKKLISDKGLQGKRVVYIGDEIRDIIAAHKAGITSVAVTWGYNSAKALKSDKPDFLVDEPEGLLDVTS